MKAFGWSVRKVVIGLGVLGALIGAPVAASATVYTPPVGSSGDNDLNDLDHFQMYAWQITDTSLQNKTITSAVLTFTKMRNFDTNANRLYIDLLDYMNAPGATVNSGAVSGWGTCSTVATGCVSQFMDDPSGSSSGALRDDFTSPGSYDYNGVGGITTSEQYVNRPGWIVPSALTVANGGVTALTSKVFLGPGEAYPGSCAGGNAEGCIDPTGWSHSGSYGDGWYDYTYTFSGTQLTALYNYINAPLVGTDALGTFALALDPDCHFFNDGVSLSIETASAGTQSAVPEPASLLLIGTGLAIAARTLRKKRAPLS